MLFSYNWLKSIFSETLKKKENFPKPKKLAEILTMHSFEVETVKPLKMNKRIVDWIFDIDVLPNRGPDCFSHLGIVREIACLLGKKIKIEFPQAKKEKNLKTKDFVKIEAKKSECFRYCAQVIEDLKVGPSPFWISEKLNSCGLNSINNVVDIANYVMLEIGQPIHIFDLDKIEGEKIIVRRAKKGEKITTLDEKTYFLDDDILIISDSKDPLAIAGIKGGKKAEVSFSTKNILIESANFNPSLIKKASRKLNLRTDASVRFEVGIDPSLALEGIKRTSFLIKKFAGGKVADIYDLSLLASTPKIIKLKIDYLKKVLGIEIPLQKIKNILKNLGIQIKEKDKNTLILKPPTFRLDLLDEEDIVEEIGRIYGYEKIKPLLPTVSLIPSKENETIIWKKKTKDILKNAGFCEVYNYSFIGQKEKKEILDRKVDLIEVLNPLSETYKYLRPSLVFGLLKNVSFNLKYFEEIKIFELGKIFKKESPKRLTEKESVACLLFKKEKDKDIFYEMKGVCDFLLKGLGISDFFYDEFELISEEKFWHPQKTAQIKINNNTIGFLGEISPLVLKFYKIEGSLAIFELDFEKLIEFASEQIEYIPPSPYPAVIRDISLLVPPKTKIDEVVNQITIEGKEIIKDIEFFDEYTDESFEGRKSLAFRIIYQRDDRTLTSKEIDLVHKKIIQRLEKNYQWEVRK